MKRLIVTLFLIATALALPLRQSLAQWQQTSVPGGGFTTALFAKGDLLFAGNFEHYTLTNTDPDAGTLYRSTDHALTWAPSNTGFTGVPNAFANSDTSLFVARVRMGYSEAWMTARLGRPSRTAISFRPFNCSM